MALVGLLPCSHATTLQRPYQLYQPLDSRPRERTTSDSSSSLANKAITSTTAGTKEGACYLRQLWSIVGKPEDVGARAAERQILALVIVGLDAGHSCTHPVYCLPLTFPIQSRLSLRLWLRSHLEAFSQFESDDPGLVGRLDPTFHPFGRSHSLLQASTHLCCTTYHP